MKSILRALKQRALVQWALAYLAAAWLLLQLFSILADQFNWPVVLERSLTVLLAVGVLVVIVIGWFHGERGRQRLGAIEGILLAGVVLFAAGGLAVVRRTSAPASLDEPAGRPLAVAQPARNSIAVLPFVNQSGDRDTDYLGDGITEQLIDALANSPDLHVASRTSSFEFKDARTSVAEVGRRLRVANVLEGSVRRSGNQLRITAQLIKVADGYHLWSRSFDRPLGDIFALQDELSREIVSALQGTLSTDGRRDPPTRDLEAYDLYLRGLYQWRQNPLGTDSAIHLLERATARDPRFALAFASLAAIYQARNFAEGHRTSRYRESAFVAVAKALALDPSIPEAYLVRGNMAYTIERGFNIEAATRDWRRALELNPRHADAHNMLGSAYQHVGLNERALQAFRTALQLDPHSEFARYRIPRVLMFQGRFAEALAELERESDRETNWHWPLALWYNGRAVEARESIHAMSVRGKNGDVRSVYALILAGTDRHAEAKGYIAEAVRLGEGGSHFHHAAYNIASAYALMGERAEAIRWLRRVAREGFPNYELFARDPNLNSLRRDPEFVRFLAEQRRLWEHHAAVL